MNSPTEVSVTKESLAFSAAHFLTLPGHVCERLHGHNYRVGVRVEGQVDPATGFVADFAVLKQVIRALIEPLDHRLLIPADNPDLRIREDGDHLRLDYRGPDWLVIPRPHACLLPVRHTTAELLAAYLGDQVWAGLTTGGVGGLQRVIVEVEESPGQGAAVERGPGARPFMS